MMSRPVGPGRPMSMMAMSMGYSMAKNSPSSPSPVLSTAKPSSRNCWQICCRRSALSSITSARITIYLGQWRSFVCGDVHHAHMTITEQFDTIIGWLVVLVQCHVEDAAAVFFVCIAGCLGSTDVDADGRVRLPGMFVGGVGLSSDPGDDALLQAAGIGADIRRGRRTDRNTGKQYGDGAAVSTNLAGRAP